MTEQNQNGQTEEEKLNSWANIIDSIGGVVGNASKFVNKDSTDTTGGTTPPAPYRTGNDNPEDKKDNKLIYIGVGVLALIVIVAFLKKKK